MISKICPFHIWLSQYVNRLCVLNTSTEQLHAAYGQVVIKHEPVAIWEEKYDRWLV